MPEYKYIVSELQAGARLDKALSDMCQEASRSQIQKAIKGGSVKLNDQIISNLSSKVKENDQLQIILEEDVPDHIVPADIPLDIVFEDDDLIVINKSADMTVHPGAGNHSDTLVNALMYHSQELSDVGGEMRPGIVHRLDKDTSGLMVVAKNNKAHAHLAEQIESRELKRKYKALIWGMIKQTSGTIETNIGRSKLDRKKMAVLKNGGKSAITHYNTLEVFRGGLFSLVECTLETGRTHQIRVHMSHIGHSIFGDQTYGNNSRKIDGCPEEMREFLRQFKRQALHSFYISFLHPSTGERLEFEKGAPEDYSRVIEFLRA